MTMKTTVTVDLSCDHCRGRFHKKDILVEPGKKLEIVGRIECPNKCEGKRTYGSPLNLQVEDESNCVETVEDVGRFSWGHQCTRPRGHGKDGLYCKVHAKRNSA
jgi:hypothetical protein